MASEDATLQFIKDYKSHVVLWNATDKGYTNKTIRNAAYTDIAGKYNMTIKAVKSKIKSLRSYFSREHRKTRASGAEEQHESNWFAYHSLTFITADGNTAKVANSAEATVHEEDPTDIFDEEIPSTSRNLSSSTASTRTNNDSQSNRAYFTASPDTRRNYKRKRLENERNEEKAYNTIKAANVLAEKDDCTIFGQMIACQLRKLNDRNQAIAKNRIQNIIFDLEMEQFASASSDT